MKVDFSREGTATAAAPVPGVEEITVVVDGAPPVPNPCTAVAPIVPPEALLPAPTHGPVIVDDDKIALADIIIPTLNIVQGVGDLNKAFDQGAVIFDKKHVVAAAPPKSAAGKPQTPVSLVVIGFRPTRYAEKIQGSSGGGRILKTLSEVEAVGGTTVWKEAFTGSGKTKVQNKPYFQPLATALVLVQAPADVSGLADPVDTVFPMTIEREGSEPIRFGIAFWHLRGTSHTAVARPLKTARTLGVLRGPVGYKGRWITVGTEYKPFEDGAAAYVPKFRIGESTPDDVRELAKGALDALLSAE